VARVVFARLSRPPLEAIRVEWDEGRKNELAGRHAHDVVREQVRRSVEDLRARYFVVSPALRDLAEDLEIRLNAAIAEQKRMESSPAQTSTELTMFTEDAFAQLIELCEDLPGLFYASTTTHRDRKEIIRTMVDEVIGVERTPEVITAEIFWADGSAPTVVEAYLYRYAYPIIAELAATGMSNLEIAGHLNELNLQNSRGRAWSRLAVWAARRAMAKRGNRGERNEEEPRVTD
jgi:hypothetical protein